MTVKLSFFITKTLFDSTYVYTCMHMHAHPECKGHAHHYVITITSSSGPNGGSSALPRPSSYTAAPRRTTPGPSNLCQSYLTTLITIQRSYGCLVKKREKKEYMYVKDRCDELEGPPPTSKARPTTSEGAWAFFTQIVPPCRNTYSN